jgi:hypothetical protein
VWNRLWNDYSDIDPDRAAENLNTLDFPKFQSLCVEDGSDDSSDQQKRRCLAELVQHEHELAKDVLRKLETVIQSRGKHARPLTVPAFRWYMDVLDAFQDRYDAKTIFIS